MNGPRKPSAGQRAHKLCADNSIRRHYLTAHPKGYEINKAAQKACCNLPIPCVKGAGLSGTGRDTPSYNRAGMLAVQWMETKMNKLNKAAVALAAMSMVAAPVAASAASIADLRAVSAVEGSSEMEGSSWILILLGVAAAIAGIVAIADGSDDSPTSP